MSRVTPVFTFTKRVLRDFIDDECPVRAAALAYAAVFAFPAVVALLLVIAGTVWDPEDVQRAMNSQFGALVGSDVANTLSEVLRRAERPGKDGIGAAIISIVLLLGGATGALGQLQAALNNAWEVQPDPHQGGVRRLLAKRFASALLIVGLGILLITSLLLSTIMSALSQIATFLPEGTFQLVDLVVSFSILTVMFAGIFKFLPDAEVEWRDVWLGAALTTAILVGGKFVVSLYLGRSAPGSAYGVAGALAAVLVWAYFAALTVLLGAEITQEWVTRQGREIRPEKGAMRVPRELRTRAREVGAQENAMERNSETPDVERKHDAPTPPHLPRVASPPRAPRKSTKDAARHFMKTVRRYPLGAALAVASAGVLIWRRLR